MIDNISNYFGKAYENDLKEINNFFSSYKDAIDSIPPKEHYTRNRFIVEKQSEFENLYNTIINCLKRNKTKIESPSQKISLDSSNDLIKSFNDFVSKVNKQILEYNKKINNREASLYYSDSEEEENT